MGARRSCPATTRPSRRRCADRAAVYRVLVKICVSTAGTVDKVTIMKGADPLLDEGVITHVEDLAVPAAARERRSPSRSATPRIFEFKPQ